MASIRCLLLSGAAALMLSAVVGAAPATAAPLVLAQAEPAPEAAAEPVTEGAPAAEEDPVALAEKAVEEARAALRHAMATGGDVRGARRDLQAAIRHLNEVREAAETQQDQGAEDETEAAGAPAEEPAESTAPVEPPAAEAPSESPVEPPAAEAPATPPALAAPEAPPPAAALPDPSAATEPPPLVAPAAPPAESPQMAAPEAPAVAPPAVLPTLPVPGEPLTGGGEPPAEPSAEKAATEPPATAEQPETQEKPGFFERLFGGRQPIEEQPKADQAAEETPEDAPEPSLPIFDELPPLDGPKVVAVAPGEAEVLSQEDDRRIIVKQGSRVTVKHDDNDRFRRRGEEVKVEEGQGGTTVTTVSRTDGTEVVTVRDAGGDILQRYRKKESGEVEMLIGDRDRDGKPRQSPGAPPSRSRPDGPFDFSRTLPRLVVPIPQNQYIIASQGASRSQIEQALTAPPVEAIERPYSLEEIRRSERLRAKLRRIDVDTVNFEFAAATIAEDQIPNLQAIGNALADILAEDPNEVFYIEGHTDAVGGYLANLKLSDQRAASIAEILTFYFNIPPENLVTQGYGEQYLKVLTAAPERQNRRVSVRRITPLLVGRLQ